MSTNLTLSNCEEYIEIISNGTAVSAKRDVIIDFHAKWCGPCRMMKPYYDRAEKFIKDETKINLDFLSCDVDEAEEIAAAFNISAMPTIVLMKNGKEIDRKVGAFRKEEDILTFIGKYFDTSGKDDESIDSNESDKIDTDQDVPKDETKTIITNDENIADEDLEEGDEETDLEKNNEKEEDSDIIEDDDQNNNQNTK